MVKPGDVLEVPSLGVRFEFRRTAADTGGEITEADVAGRARGFIAQPHVHRTQTERHEVIEGTLAMRMGGRDRILVPGESVVTLPGIAHRHVAAGDGPVRVRMEWRPSGRIEEFVEALAEMDRRGEFTRAGLPKPVPGARLVLGFIDEAHGAFPPRAVQRVVAQGILRVAGAGSNEYVFVDEWDVAAPVEAVHEAVRDAGRFPDWWRPVYLAVRTEGAPGVGQVAHHRFRGRLPYELKVTTRTVRDEPSTLVENDVDGDLRGTGRWTLTPRAGGTHVRFDWIVAADRRFLRVLTPVLRPAFRWNHHWAIARAREGLEPHAQRLAAERATARGPEMAAG
jgi:quercetin dioxygenase-like cupin family protein